MAPSASNRPAWVIRGTITDFKSERGYGFISGDDGRNYFFHVNHGRMGTPGDGFIRGVITDRAPRDGERVYFLANPPKNSKNPSASPWAFDDVSKP